MADSAPSFLWFDYETFGRNPRLDRPSQFAAVRTNADLEEIEAPIDWLCAPGDELVPSPDACLLTGLTPQFCAANGIAEREFAQRIFATLSQPGTCAAGYNSLRFDDEVTRFLFYRNLLPVYDREWRNGNSRWDLLDVMRLAWALRPEGIEWPQDADGVPSFRLENLAAANCLQHEQAHDALSDVRATIALARLVKSAQPKLFEWALRCRDKAFVKAQVAVLKHQPFLHVSGMIPARQGCLTLLLPLGLHPTNRNEVVCFDLQESPEQLAGLSADDMRHRLFTSTDELGDTPRLPVKSVHINKCPMVAPVSMFTDAVADRHGLDRRRMLQNSRELPDLGPALSELMAALTSESPERDAESALYQGFFDRADESRLALLHSTPEDGWDGLERPHDPRLAVLWQRFRARYGSRPLPDDVQAEWHHFLCASFSSSEVGGSLSLHDAAERLTDLKAEHPDSTVLRAVGEFLDAQQTRARSINCPDV